MSDRALSSLVSILLIVLIAGCSKKPTSKKQTPWNGPELIYQVDLDAPLRIKRQRDGARLRRHLIASRLNKKVEQLTADDRTKNAGRLSVGNCRPKLALGCLELRFADKADAAVITKKWLTDTAGILDYSIDSRRVEKQQRVVRLKMSSARANSIRETSQAYWLLQMKRALSAAGLRGWSVDAHTSSAIRVRLPSTTASKLASIKQLLIKQPEIGFRPAVPTTEASKLIGQLYAELEKKRPKLAKRLRLMPETAWKSSYLWSLSLPALQQAALFRRKQKIGIKSGQALSGKLYFERVVRTGKYSSGPHHAWRTHVLLASTSITGKQIDRTRVFFGRDNQPYVSLDLSIAGSVTFASLTRDNVRRVLGITIGDTVISAPLIRETITGGRVRIDLGSDVAGAAKLREATQIALSLQQALHAPPRLTLIRHLK